MIFITNTKLNPFINKPTFKMNYEVVCDTIEAFNHKVDMNGIGEHGEIMTMSPERVKRIIDDLETSAEQLKIVIETLKKQMNVIERF